MTEGMWGFIGVITGSVLSIFFQCFIELRREKIKYRNEFALQINNIEKGIHILKEGMKLFLNINEIDFKKYTEEEIYEELNPTMDNISYEIIKIWPELKQNIIQYYSSIYFNSNYKYLELSIEEYYNINNRIKIINGFYNLLEYLKEKHDVFNNSLSLIDKFEKLFFKTIKKIRKNIL